MSLDSVAGKRQYVPQREPVRGMTRDAQAVPPPDNDDAAGS